MTRPHDLPWEEYEKTLQPHEKPTLMGSPATPDHHWRLRLAYGAIGVLVAITGGLGAGVVTANIQSLAGNLGVTTTEAAWLPVVYVMTNACMNLILVKFRQQYGLQPFARIMLGVFVIVAIGNVFASTFQSELLTRAVAGICGAGMSSLGFLYLIQAFPAAHRLKGLVIGIGLSSFALPIARIASSTLLDLAGWEGLYLSELGLALLSLACGVQPAPAAVATHGRLPPPRLSDLRPVRSGHRPAVRGAGSGPSGLVDRGGVDRLGPYRIHRPAGDGLRHRILSQATADRSEVAGRRRSDPPVVGHPADPDRSVGTDLGLGRLPAADGPGPRPASALFWVILVAMMAGTATSALSLNMAKLYKPIAIALALIAIGTFIDSHATSLTRPVNLFFSQALLAFASALFIGPALMIGITQVLIKGPQYLVSFIVTFSVGQNVGGLAGSALVGTVETIREKYHSSQLAESINLGDPQVVLRLQQLGGAYARVQNDTTLRTVDGLRLLTQQVTTQAHVLAYNDVFLMISIAAALGCAWTTFVHFRPRILARRAAAREAASAAASAH
jgi:MFS family permease